MTVVDAGAFGPGFADPGRDSQTVFRALLAAMAHPGRIVVMPASPAAPAPLAPAAAAMALTLLDDDTPVWLDEAAGRQPVRDYLRFHCGAPIAAEPAVARFAIVAGALPPLALFAVGTDADPDRSATLILQVERLSSPGPIALRGPGIDGTARLFIDPLPGRLPEEWAGNNALFPCGVDLLLVAGNVACALPRTTRMEV